MSRPQRLPRTLLSIATRASRVLCIALIAAWALSYLLSVWFWYTPLGGRWRLSASTQRGVLLFHLGDYYNFDAPSFSQHPDPAWDRGAWGVSFLPAPLESTPGWRGLRVETVHLPFSPRRRGRIVRTIRWFKSREVTVAYWPLVLLTGVLPLARAVRRRRAPIAHGLCARCGYDLRATPERCPECGRPATIASPATPGPRG